MWYRQQKFCAAILRRTLLRPVLYSTEFLQQQKQVRIYFMTPDENFEQLHLELPPPTHPRGLYKTLVVQGNTCYLAGHGPLKPDNSYMRGKVGLDLSLEEGKEAAHQTALAIIATIKSKLGSLNKIKSVIKITGLVNCVPDFRNHPTVMDGCSELFAKIWGDENGLGVRSTVGISSVPFNVAVEIEAVFELYD